MGLIPSRNPWQKRQVLLEGDLPCVHCTYNLRGLPLSGRCPECGGAIWDSLLRKDLPVFYRSVQMASAASFALAASPLLICATLALENTVKNAPEPILITAALAILCLGGGCLSWLTLPLFAFRPGKSAIKWTWFSLIPAVLFLFAGTVLCLTAPASQIAWVGRAWDAAILSTCACYAISLRNISRMLYMLEMPGTSRLILLLQIAASLCGIVSLASIGQEFMPAAGQLRPTLYTLSAVCGMTACVILTAVAFRFRRYAAPAFGR